MSYSLGSKSRAELQGVHPNLVKVVERAAKKMEFRVLEGVRTPERQRELYAQGRTKPGNIVTWTLNSNHFKKADGYGHAVDLFPAPYDWNNLASFDALSRAMFDAARELNIPIRWGADWDRDGQPRERGESDSPHFELFAGPVQVPASDVRPTLRLGSRGGHVADLQRRVGISADGVFGPKTEAAVKAFQQSKGLSADGVVGARTWGAIG